MYKKNFKICTYQTPINIIKEPKYFKNCFMTKIF